MALQQSPPIQRPTERAERVISHALVELRRNRWWPFGVRSAVLLDVSEGGFKIEFTGNTKCVTGEKLLMEIPLGPFGILAPRSLLMNVQIMWFDDARMRCGGIFVNTNPTTVLFIQKIIEASKGLSA